MTLKKAAAHEAECTTHIDPASFVNTFVLIYIALFTITKGSQGGTVVLEVWWLDQWSSIKNEKMLYLYKYSVALSIVKMGKRQILTK